MNAIPKPVNVPDPKAAKILIVGAGPAGIAAADVLASRGLRPILADEGRTAGGQGYRKSDPVLDLHLEYATAPDYRSVHALFERLDPQIDYRPETLVWSVDGSHAYLARRGTVEAHGQPYDGLVLATGATDRIAPVPGWTLPGVYSLGGAQVLLKDQGCAIGRKVVFYGSSPLLYLAASQYLEAGISSVTILDTTPFGKKLLAGWKIASAPDVLKQGLSLLMRLRRRGVRVFNGVSGLRIEGEGEGRVSGVRFRSGKADHRLFCDGVAIGHGLRSETQLAELAGATLAFDPVFCQWLPQTDAMGRAAPRLYVAGDGARIGGAQAASLSGRLAGLACLADLGLPVDRTEIDALTKRRASYWEAQAGLARAFAWPAAEIAALPDDAVLCRCENVTAGTVRHVARDLAGEHDINRVKALTRCGMGRCQSRMCGQAAIEVAAVARAISTEAMTHYRPQPPIKPVFIPAPAWQAEKKGA